MDGVVRGWGGPWMGWSVDGVVRGWGGPRPRRRGGDHGNVSDRRLPPIGKPPVASRSGVTHRGLRGAPLARSVPERGLLQTPGLVPLLEVRLAGLLALPPRPDDESQHPLATSVSSSWRLPCHPCCRPSS